MCTQFATRSPILKSTSTINTKQKLQQFLYPEVLQRAPLLILSFLFDLRFT
jgi:hypothetical protein